MDRRCRLNRVDLDADCIEMTAVRMIRVRYDGSCVVCGAELVARSHAWWDPSAKTLCCPPCAESEGLTTARSDRLDVLAPAQAMPTGPVENVAGRSAQKRFDQLHGQREARVRKRFPRAGGLLLSITDDPQSTRAWGKGAAGERRFGATLDALTPSGIVVLHDRLIPGKRSNIDHVVIAASGIWVIDSKNYEGEVTRKEIGGWRTTDHHLYVNGRDRSRLLEGVSKQAGVVREVLGDASGDLQVRPALCFVSSTWGWFAKPFEIDGVRVAWPKAMVDLVSQEGPCASEVATRIAAILAERLRPA